MTNERTHAVVALIFGVGAQVACSGGGNLNIGNTSTVGANLSDYAASWDGYAQAYAFSPDGSDHVRLTIDKNGQGTLRVGDAAIVPPPTDPSVGYPSEAAAASLIGASGPQPPINEGALYPLYSAQIQADRIQFGIKPKDYYAAWCALQQPVPTSYRVVSSDGGVAEALLPPASGGSVPPGDGGVVASADGGFSVWHADAGGLSTGDVVVSYNCAWLPESFDLGSDQSGSVPQSCTIRTDIAIVPIDCGKFALCSGFCACTATNCTSAPEIAAGNLPSQYPVELDAALDATGRTLTGTLLLSANLRVTVVLTKQ